MASFSFTIGIVGNIISILVFASPIKTFWGVVKKKSTEDYKGLPYMTTLLSTSLWTFYGLLKPDGLLVVTVNATGAVLQFIYTTLFLTYAPKKKKVKLVKLIALMNVGFLGSVIAVGLLAFHGNKRLTFAGVISAGFTLGMYAAPLSVMRTVITARSVEFMPFSLSFFLFLNGSIWSIYAVLVKDYFIGVPNGIGLVLGSIQLIVYGIYKRESKSFDPTKKMEEEGSAHLVRGAIQMSTIDGDVDAQMEGKIRNLHKGSSLPKPHVSPQYSLKKIAKARSLSSYELNSSWPNEADIENPENGHRP